MRIMREIFFLNTLSGMSKILFLLIDNNYKFYLKLLLLNLRQNTKQFHKNSVNNMCYILAH